MTIKEFTADEDGLTIVINNTIEPIEVDFYLSDNTKVTVASPSVTDAPYYTFVYATDASNGVYTAVVNPLLGDEETAAIVNMTNAIHFMLGKVLREEYDSRLMQELEAVKYYTLLQEESLLRSTYDEITIRIAECESNTESLKRTGIHILDNRFIIR